MVPGTLGQLRTNVADMDIGDYIACDFTWSKPFSNLGKPLAVDEIPYTGLPDTNAVGFFYLVKVAKGLLVADRIVINNINWTVLNTAKLIEGLPWSNENIAGVIRSLTGGVAYRDIYNIKALTENNNGGWPKSNEYDRYIVNFPKEKIQGGSSLDDVFHWSVAGSFCRDTPISGVIVGTTTANHTYRVVRGKYSDNQLTEKGFGFGVYTTSYPTVGFRPVFEYEE